MNSTEEDLYVSRQLDDLQDTFPTEWVALSTDTVPDDDMWRLYIEFSDDGQDWGGHTAPLPYAKAIQVYKAWRAKTKFTITLKTEHQVYMLDVGSDITNMKVVK